MSDELDLTFDETIKAHRKMWFWIAQQTYRKQRIITSWDYLPDIRYAPYIANSSYACNFVYQHLIKHRITDRPYLIDRFCQFCPFEWPEKNEYGIPACKSGANSNLHDRYLMTISDRDWRLSAAYAGKIAEVPAKDPDYLEKPSAEASYKNNSAERYGANAALNLLLDDTIREHRKMWSWIAEQTQIKQKCFSKADYFSINSVPGYLMPKDSCYCCDFAYSVNGNTDCWYCPVVWPDRDNGVNCCITTNQNGLFNAYMEAYKNNQWEKAAAYAKYIAQLPKRNFN